MLHLEAYKFSKENPIVYISSDDQFVDVKKTVEYERDLANVQTSFPTLVSTPHQLSRIPHTTIFHVPVPPSLLYSLVYVYGLLCRRISNKSKALIENYKNSLMRLAAGREVQFLFLIEVFIFQYLGSAGTSSQPSCRSSRAVEAG
jgi:hypothetical protein